MRIDTHWIDSAGGPLILLPQHLLSEWSGADSRTGRDKTDYDRACAIGEAGILDVANGHALVLGDEPMGTRAFAHPSGIVLARWRHAESEAAADGALSNPLHALVWTEIGILSVTNTPLVLFDSAFPGTEIITESAVLELPVDEYVVELAELAPDADTALQLVRLRA
jgi:hypothetical protein